MRCRIGWLLMICVAAVPQPAAGQSFHTFTGAGSVSPYFDPVDWSVPPNWQGNSIPPSNINTGVIIGSVSAGTSVNNLGTFILTTLQFNVGTTLGGNPLDMRSSLGSSLIVMNTNSAVALNNNLIATTADINVSNSNSTTGQITLAGQVSGTGGLQIGNGGAATVTLTNNNTYSGTTTLYGGQLTLGAIQSLPTGTNVHVIVGQLNLNGHDQAIGSLTLSDPSTSGTGNYANANVNLNGAYLILGGNVTYSPMSTSYGALINDNGQGHIDLNGATRTFTVGVGSDNARNGVDLELNTGIVGTGGLIKAGPGILFAGSGTWTFTGATQITGGAISLSQANQLPANTAVSLSNGASLNFGPPSQLLFGGPPQFYNQTVGSLAGTSGTTVNILEATLTVGTDNTNNAFYGQLTGAGGSLLKVGTGQLTLGNASNNYSGGTMVNAGTLVAGADGSLGSGPITVGPLGTLIMNGNTSRTFNLNGGNLASGSVVQFLGATVIGGFLSGGSFSTALTGAGTTFVNTTIRSSVTLNLNSVGSTGTDSLVNVTSNGQVSTGNGQLAVPFVGVTNGAGGRMNLGGTVNASDFISYGQINLTGSGLLRNTGASSMVFGGGSRTFIGTVGGNGLAQLELNGQNAEVAGGLLVNNGHVTDSSAAGISTIIADYGALVKGGGIFDNPVKTQNGGRFQAGQ
jgi:fibronectin-binding autotransporter adhesin